MNGEVTDTEILFNMTKDFLDMRLVDLAHDILDVRSKFYTQTLDFNQIIKIE